MADIVERLREEAAKVAVERAGDKGLSSKDVTGSVIWEASNEIERLQAALELPAVDAEDIRDQKLATIVAPDNGTPKEVLAAVLECATAWGPEARIIGNVRAGDIAKAARAALAIPEETKEPYRYAEARSFEETVDGCLRVWFSTPDPDAVDPAYRIVMTEIVKLVRDIEHANQIADLWSTPPAEMEG